VRTVIRRVDSTSTHIRQRNVVCRAILPLPRWYRQTDLQFASCNKPTIYYAAYATSRRTRPNHTFAKPDIHPEVPCDAGTELDSSEEATYSNKS